MTAQTKVYWPLAAGVAAVFGVVSGIVAASFGFKLLKPLKGG
jgi:hypothetical protein